MAALSGDRGSSKSTLADQISQSVQPTSNLLYLMLESSPSHTLLSKLPKNILSKTSVMKNAELLLSNMQSSQLKSFPELSLLNRNRNLPSKIHKWAN